MAKESLEERLSQSNDRLRLLIESVTDYAIFTLELDGVIATWNTGAQKLTGYSESEILGQHFSILCTPEDRTARHAEFELKIAREAGRYEEEGVRVRKDGTRFFANIVITPIREPNGNLVGFATVTRDITERRELFDTEERFKLMIESVTDYAIFMLDPQGYVASWNAGAERIKGYRASEIIGHHFSEFYITEDKQSGKPKKELEVAISQGRFEDEGWRLRKDGSRFWANVAITPVREKDGTLRGFAKVTRDMTARREIEEKLKELNRELESFAYSVAHDLRAPLRSILFTSHLIKEEAGGKLGDEVEKLLDTQISSSTALASVVEDILNLTRMARKELKVRNLDLSILAAEVVRQIEQKGCVPNCTFYIQPNIRARGDETLLRIVLQNLFDNACKYSPSGGQVSFTMESRDGQAIYMVRDQGMGFEMEYKQKIFLPFERLVDETQFEGSGIGLTNVERAVQRHGGKVWVESELGKGSCFYFTLAPYPG